MSQPKSMKLPTARMPPVKAMLEKGIPGLTTLDAIITDLDQQLEAKNKQMADCLKGIVKTCNDMPGNKQSDNPKDCITYMLDSHLLEKDSCYDPESDDINTILSHVSSTLQQTPGSEEIIFQDLLSLSSCQGLTLPLKSSNKDPLQSMTSLNTVTDSVEQQVSEEWEHIARRFQQYFQHSLENIPVSAKPLSIDLYEKKRVNHLQSLSVLFPTEDVLVKYQTLRSLQLDQCFQNLLAGVNADNFSSIDVTKNCCYLADIILKMIKEDFIVFNSGVFKRSFNIARAMHDMYLEKYSDEMSALVEDIWEDIEEIMNKKSSKNSSKAKLSVRNVSSDSLPSTKSFSSITAAMDKLPRDYIASIVNVVNSILYIEEHVEKLIQTSAWDSSGLPSRKIKRKGSLKGVLKTSSSPEPPRRPMSYTGTGLEDFTDSLNSSFGSYPGLSDNTPAPKVVEKSREERLRWEWKLMFKKIGHDLAQFVNNQIRNQFKVSLDKELADWTNLHVLVTKPVKEELWGGKLDYPKFVTKAVLDFMNELDFLLPFAKAGYDGALHSVRTAYVDSVCLCLQNLHVHLTKLCSDIPRNAPMKSLYAILSSAAYVRNQLNYYETVLVPEESSKKIFAEPHKKFVEVVDVVTKLMIEIHKNYMATSILHDAESYNWADMKDFHEGERCSYPIQMWNYHMRGLQYDLWTMCPPRLGQKIFGEILQESLQILGQRYAHAQPSYKRIPQFRCDIITVLLCTVEMLFHSCRSLYQILDVGDSHIPHYNIQNLCTTLLSTMAIVSSPLEILYREFKKGYMEKTQRGGQFSPVANTTGTNTDWLSWIQPGVFQRGLKQYDVMQTTTAVYIQCKLLLTQPEIDWAMTLQSLVMKDYTLAILVLTQCVAGEDGHTVTGSLENVKKTFQCMTRVLSECPHFPDAVAKTILPVIDRCNDWKVFEPKTMPGKDFIIPVWMESLFELMEPFVLRVLQPLLEHILIETHPKPNIRPIMSVIADLPCGCQPHTTTTSKPKKGDATKELIDTCLTLLLGQITEDIFVLPTSLCILLKMIQERCSSNGIKTPHQSAGLKVLAMCLRSALMDKNFIERTTGVSPTESQEEHLTTLAECIYYVLVSTKAKSSSTPKLGGKFCKENKELAVEKVTYLGNFFNAEIFEVPSSSVLEAATNEFKAQLFSVCASNILDTSIGASDLRCLYNIIANNFLWLEKHLDIQNVLPKTLNIPQHFTISTDSPTTPAFDPTLEFELIGNRKFDHDAVMNFNIDWQKLLASDLGLSEYGFRTLLYNRHEMQDGAYLEENEKKPVEVLRSVYEHEDRELG
ncbi:uncharacterized protein KIAA0825-like [Mytilus californianus]|uniref:uncharacterized protein KIAA0825-like n=1 Tax=Mytilus californianus TaxID=6549 RepID=UPI002247A402|nr:uncharacterized protein KIAA0825-like [Mytilus californianus]